jgi:hypothetical protein
MYPSFFDFITCVPFTFWRLDQIPHAQGFYLIFNASAELIYVGKGYGDIRVPIHFNQATKEYFNDAYFWLWFQVNDENMALAYEKVVYYSYLKKKKISPRHNRIAPQGSPNFLQNILAKQEWKKFLLFPEYHLRQNHGL